MNKAPTKEAVLDLLRFARSQEDVMIAGVCDKSKAEIGSPERWSAKDYLVNIALWKRLQTEKIEAILRGERPPVWRDMEVVRALDNQAFAEHQPRSFDEVVAEGRQINEAFLDQVAALSEAELNDPSHFPLLDGEAVRPETLGNGIWHPISQITAYYLKHEKRDQAVSLQEALVAAVRAAGLDDDGLGVTLYNQACLYALNGWPEKALANLPEAFRLRPTLIALARHDSDLDSLRDTPAFQAILADEALLALVPKTTLTDPRQAHEMRTLLIDVRSANEYATGHVEGAVNIPLGQLESRLNEIAMDKPVVTYCMMHHRGESRGERAANLLAGHGYQASALDGGYPAWKAADLPVVEPAATK